MPDARVYTCPHCEREFKSETAPGKDGIECPWCQMRFRSGRAYLDTSEAPTPNKERPAVRKPATPDEVGCSPMSILRAIKDPPGLSQIEDRVSKCLLARVCLAVAGCGMIASILCAAGMAYGLCLTSGGDIEGGAVLIPSFVGTCTSAGIVVLSYGFAQHYSHVAKTAMYLERLCSLVAGRDPE